MVTISGVGGRSVAIMLSTQDNRDVAAFKFSDLHGYQDNERTVLNIYEWLLEVEYSCLFRQNTDMIPEKEF